jgi:hypothetical protein
MIRILLLDHYNPGKGILLPSSCRLSLDNAECCYPAANNGRKVSSSYYLLFPSGSRHLS